jgi:hypothetical protein
VEAYDIYLFDPASGVQLNINKATVTCHLLGIAIYNRHHLAPIQQHYCLQLQWLGHSFDNIDWKQYAMTSKRFPDNVLFTANLDGRNNGGGKASQKKSWYDHPCPKCSQEHKEDNHLFQCKQVSQTQWRTMQIATVSEKFHTILAPDLLAIIRIGLWAYLPCLQHGIKKNNWQFLLCLQIHT